MTLKLFYWENILPDSKYISIIEPGLEGYKELPYIKAIENAFLRNNISIFSIDQFNSLGESDGNFENATFESHLNSINIAINIVKEKYPDKKIIIVGHSVSGMVVLYYAARNNNIEYVVPFAPLISGDIYENPKDIDKLNEIKKWKKDGFRLKPGKDGKEYKVSYNFVESLKNMDLFDEVNKIKIPVLLIANEKDKTTNLNDLKELYRKLNIKSKFTVIENAPHLIKDETQLKALENAIFDFFRDNISI